MIISTQFCNIWVPGSLHVSQPGPFEFACHADFSHPGLFSARSNAKIKTKRNNMEAKEYYIHTYFFFFFNGYIHT